MSRFWKWLAKPFARNISPTLCRSGPVAEADLKFPDKFARLVAQVMESEWPSKKPFAPLPARCCGTCAARSSDGVCRQVFTTPKKWKRPDGVVLDRAVMRDDAGQSCDFWSDDPEYMTPRPKETATEALRGWGYGFVDDDPSVVSWHACYGVEERDTAVAVCLRELIHTGKLLYVQAWEETPAGDRIPVGRREILYQGSLASRLNQQGYRGTDAMTALGRMTNEQCESAN